MAACITKELWWNKPCLQSFGNQFIKVLDVPHRTEGSPIDVLKPTARIDVMTSLGGLHLACQVFLMIQPRSISSNLGRNQQKAL